MQQFETVDDYIAFSSTDNKLRFIKIRQLTETPKGQFSNGKIDFKVLSEISLHGFNFDFEEDKSVEFKETLVTMTGGLSERNHMVVIDL